jgi:hypothetical protein
MRYVSWVAGLVGVAGLLSGCGAATNNAQIAPGGVAPSTSTTPADWRCSSDPYGPAAPKHQSLPAGFRPVALYSCGQDFEKVPGEGEWRVGVQRRAGSGLEPVVAALRLPDEPRSTGACTMEYDADGEVWLVDAAGRAVLPRWPRNGCGHLRPETGAALGRLTYDATTRRREALQTPQSALDSGCPTAYKNMVAIEAPTAHGPGSFAAMPKLAGAVCRYRTDDAETPSGPFITGHKADRAQWAALLAALEATGPAQPCHRNATEFVVIAESAYAEMDGCQRVLTPDNALRQATPVLIDQLTAILTK